MTTENKIMKKKIQLTKSILQLFLSLLLVIIIGYVLNRFIHPIAMWIWIIFIIGVNLDGLKKMKL